MPYLVTCAQYREEVLEVIDYARSHGFAPRLLLIHDENGQLKLSPEEERRLHEIARRCTDHNCEGLVTPGQS